MATKYKTTDDPNAIENIVCVPMHKTKKIPMDEEMSKLLLTTLFASKDVVLDEKDKPFLFKVIEKRLTIMDIDIPDQRLILMLCMIAETPGSAVLLLWYLQYWAKTNGAKSITLDLFCEKIFPWGIISKQDLSEIWDSQKVDREGYTGSDNLVDYASAGQSLKLTA